MWTHTLSEFVPRYIEELINTIEVLTHEFEEGVLGTCTAYSDGSVCTKRRSHHVHSTLRALAGPPLAEEGDEG